MSKLIAIGSDHGGFELKEVIKAHLIERGLKFIDIGPQSNQSVDYPEFAHKLCEKIQSNECGCGILCCGTGIGMSMAANKHKGIRAACCSEPYSARLTRLHNDANVLCMGARVVGPGLALDIVDQFLDTGFEGGRHIRRVEAVNALDLSEK